MAQAKATIDHDTIKRWVEERGGCPAQVKGSGAGDDPGILRIDFPGYSGKRSLEKLSWDTFFEAFEDNGLAFLYQDEDKSRFSKLVSRENAELEDSPQSKSKDGAAKKSSSGRNGKKAAAGNGGKAKSTNGKNAINALELLESQHREVEGLFEKLEGARSDAQKEKIFAKLADALAAHSKIEEEIFYPCVFADDTETELRESVEEHLIAKRLLADMLEMEASHPQFMSKVAVLKEVIRHHVEEEEQELFKEVRDHEEDDLGVLGKKMQQRYKQLMQSEPRMEIPKESRAAAVPF